MNFLKKIMELPYRIFRRTFQNFLLPRIMRYSQMIMEETSDSSEVKKSVSEVKLIRIEEKYYQCIAKPGSFSNNELLTSLDRDIELVEDEDAHKNAINLTKIMIEKIEDTYKHYFFVPRAYHQLIASPKNVNQKKLDISETVAIRVPPSNSKIKDTVITGNCLGDVLAARHSIEKLVKTSRLKLRPTHFIAIPMVDETIATNFQRFKSQVIHETGKDCAEIDERLFQKPEKMHLTLGVLVFTCEEEIKAGIEALHECKEKIIMPMMEKYGAIKIKAQGLGCFNRNPAKLNVLYGTISSENDALQELADKTADFFMEKGMMKAQSDGVTLHLTLMNSSFTRSYKKFDATNILEVQKDHLFGEVALKEVQICSLTGPKSQDGYYEIISKISLVN